MLTVKKKKKMIEEFAPAALIGFVLSGLVIFLGLSQVNFSKKSLFKNNKMLNKSIIR